MTYNEILLKPLTALYYIPHNTIVYST